MKQRKLFTPRRQKAPRKSGVEFQKLEDRILFSGTPAVTIDAPSEVKIGEAATVTVTFDNADATDAGYGPWVDVFIDATGADGLVDPADPSNPQTGDTDGLANPGDQYDGFSFTTGPTYLGSAVVNTVITLDDTANGGLGVLHPYAVDTNGDPVYISTSNPLSPYFSKLNGSFSSGDKLMVMQLPFGSVTPDQPHMEISFGLTLSNHADANSVLNVAAIGGFRFGNDPLNNPATDPSIIGLPDTDSALVGVNLAELTKTYSGPENETATGANYVRTYRINVDIANGQTFSDLHIFDDLPDQIQFKQVSAASHAFTILGTPPTTVPGGDLAIRFDAPITGTAGASDAWVDVEFYVPRIFDSDASGSLTGSDAPVLSPNSGADLFLDNQAYGFGTWDPVDPRDPGTIVGLKVAAGFDPTDLTTALATASPDATPEHSNLEVSPLVVQKNFSTVTNLGAPGHSPGDLLEFTLDFQVSDYFAFQNLVIDDTMLDGLRFDASFVPTLQINGNTYVLTALGWAAANYTVSQNFTGAVASGNFVLDPAANDGSTSLAFRISDEMVTRGQNGKLVGGGIDPTAPTGAIANDLTGYNDGATTGRITYRAMILDEFTDTFPSGEPALNPRDVLTNSATITGDVLNLSSGPALTPYAGPVVSSDGSSESLTIAQDQVQKTIYAVNGNTNLALFQDPSGKINLQPGDVVTYRFTYTIPSGDVENLRLTDFLPLPIFDVDDINSDNTDGGLGEWSFVDNTANVAVSNFTPGVITYGPSHSLHTVTGPAGATPVLSIDSVTNSVKMQWGDFVNSVNNTKKVDILLSATVSSDPFADGLFLTNQVQSGEGNTQSPGSESLANAIVQIVLNEPVIAGIHKGIVASTQGGAVGTVGGLTFDTVGGAGFTGTLVGEANAKLIGDLNLDASTDVDAGDLVRFALVAVNSGRADAYDVKIQDTLVGSYVNSYASKAAFMAATNFKVLRGDGTALVEGADYTLTWNAGTKTFEVELTDNYVAGNLGGDTKPGGVSRGLQADTGTDVTNGSNAIIVLYDLTVDTDAQASSTVTNTAFLTNYAGDEGAGDHTAEDLSDNASLVLDAPAFAKVLTGTEITGPGNSALNQAAVGELVTYTLTVTVSEGTTAAGQIVDTMDDGLAFVNIVSATYSSGVTSSNTIGTGTAPANVTVGNAGLGTGNRLTFNFGNITNTEADNGPGNAETITIVYQAVVLNTTANQSGTALNNAADLTWSWVNDPDDPALANPEGNATLSSSAANVTVVEPHVDVKKYAGSTFSAGGVGYQDTTLSNQDAGNTVYFRIVITNDGTVDAHDISLSDVIPANLTGLAIRAETTSTGTVRVNGVASTVTSADFVLTGNTLSIAPGSNIDLAPGGAIVIHVEGTLDYTVSPGQAAINNDAVVKWTSMDGALADRSSYNTNSDERDGSGVTPTNNTDSSSSGTLNNYGHSDRASVGIINPAPSKSIVSTSVASSSGSSVVVGEVVRYRLTWQIPEGDVVTFNFRDNLPDGLRFLNDGTETVGFVADISTSVTSTTMGTLPYIGAAIASPATLFSIAGGTITEENPGGGFASGEDIFFNFGTLVNSESDANLEYIVLEFNAVVVNQLTNQATTVLTNTVTTRSNTTALQTSSGVDVTVVEPTLTVNKSASATPPVDAGGIIDYTITLTNSSGQAAYDVTVSDPIDQYLVVDPGFLGTVANSSVTASGGATVSANAFEIVDLGGGNFTVRTAAGANVDIPTGESVTLTFRATVSAAVPPAFDIANVANARWTSTDGANADERGGGGVADNAPTSLNQQNPGGVLNDYAISNSVITSTVNDISVSKAVTDTSVDNDGVGGTNDGVVTIGEIVTYTLTVIMPEGLAPDFQIRDNIPAGMAYVPGSAVIDASGYVGSVAAPTVSPTAGVAFGNGQDIVFDFAAITTTNDNITTNNTFTITYQAVVLDVGDRSPDGEANDGLGTTTTNLQNTATHNNGSGAVFNKSAGQADVDVVEPDLRAVKSVVVNGAGASGDAGDPATYTIVLSHDTPSNQAAFDLTFSDTLPAQIGKSLTTALDIADVTVVHSTLGDITAQFEVVGGVLQTKATADIDLQLGQTITVTISGVLRQAVAPGTSFDNQATFSYTTLDGGMVPADPNPDVTTDRERTSNETSNIVTVTVPSALAITKAVIDTSHTAVGGTSGNDLAIGETATFRLNVTMQEGTTAILTVTDTTPSGLRYVAAGATSGVFFRTSDGITVKGFNTDTVYSDGSEILAADLTDSTSDTAAGTLVFRFKEVVVPGSNGADTDSFQLDYTLRAANVAANQGETSPSKVNTAVVAADRNGDGDTSDGGETASNTATVTIKEPVLDLGKTTTTTGSDAGDTVVYTLTITNTGNATAYGINILDTLDTELALTAPGTALAFTGVPPAYVTLDQTANSASAVNSVLNELRAGDSVTITLTAQIKADANPRDLIANTASLTYSSLPGSDANERTGAGGVNDYADSATSSQFQLAAPTITKSLVTTSDANTGTSQHSGARQDLAIGEIVTYTVTVTFNEGVTNGVTISDIGQDNGTAILELLTAEVTSVGANLSASGGAQALTAGTTVTPSSPTGSSFAETAGFQFGDVTNSVDNAATGADQVVITVTARVANHVNNQNADAVQNTGRIAYTDGQGAAQTVDSSVSVDVVEPRVTVAQVVTSATTGLDAGDEVTYQVTINNLAANGATGPAYDVTLADVLPAGMVIKAGSISAPTLTSASVQAALAGEGTNSLSGIFDIQLGGSVVFTFVATVPNTVTPGQSLTSDLNVHFSSQDGAVAGERTGADVADPESNTLAADATTLNNYAVGADTTVTAINPFSVTKTLDATSVAATSGSNVAIGEILTYKLEVRVMEGITSSISLVDTLPAGLAYIAGSAVVSDANGITVNGFNASLLGQVLTLSATSVQNPGGSNATANDPSASESDSFFITYQALVENVVGNQNGTTLVNDVDASATGVTPDVDNQVAVNLVEAELSIAKTITTSTAGIDAGDTVAYQIVVSHLGSSTADAYDLILDDILPSAALENFTLVSAVISDGATDTNVAGLLNLTVGGVLSTIGDIDLRLNTNGANDQVLTITVTSTVKDALAVGTSFTNTADVQWSSLDGGLDGDDAGTTGERTGGGANPPNDYSASDSVSAATIGTLGVTKGVDKANATIGEVVTYTVTVTVAEGLTVLNLADTLPAGLTLVSNSAALTTPGGWTITGFDANSASQLLTVSNPGGSGATANNAAAADTDTFTYTYQAVVTNVIGNQSGTTLVNDLDGAADLNNDGDTTDPGETDNNNTATVTVVEPRVTIDKTALPVSGLNAGDVVTYTVVIDNLAANGATSTAFDVALSDTVPSGLLITGITSTALAGGAVQDSAAAITGGGTGLAGQFDIPVGGSVTIVYTATVQTSILPGQSLVNDADATFTSLDGAVSGERDGSGVAEPADNTHPTDAGTLNNYGVGDTISVTALSYSPLVTKAIVATSEAGSTGTDVLVGEIVRYSLKFELFEGTLNDLVIRDILPPGLQFLNDGTASFTTVNVATTVTNTAFLARDSATGSGTTFTDGSDVFFQLGSVVNNDNDAGAEYGVIAFNAIVLNTASNQSAVVLSNNFAVLYDADNNAGTAPAAVTSLRVDANDDGTPETTGQSESNTVTVTVREAALTFSETIPAGAGYDAGDVFTITYTVANNGTAPAYNVRLADLALPAEFDVTAISGATTGGGTSSTSATNLGTDSVDANLDVLEVGQTWTVTATVKLRDTVNPGDVYTNPAAVTFTSLPGANGTTGNATGSDTPGASGTATGERTGADGVGGALNDYALADSAGLSIPTPFSVTKAADKSTATIGEVVTYTVTVTVVEGTTTNIVLNDTLPAGMSFVAGSAAVTNAAGMTIAGFDTNSLDQTLTSVINPGANEAAAGTTTATGTFTYTYQAVVLDVAGNDGIAAPGDGDGQTSLVNDLDASADGVLPDNNNTAAVTVVEPRLEITKSNNDADGVVVRGQVVTYTLTVANLAGNGSTATAYDVRVRDLVPASLALTLGSINVTGATVADNSSAGNTLDLTLDSLALGSTATITFTATVGAAATGNIDNNAKIFYDSLPADEGTAPGTGNTVFGDPDGTSGDRDYGSTGPDEVFNATTDIHQDTDRITVGTFTLGDRVWFDIDGDGVQDGSEIGIGGVTATLLYAGNDGIFGNADDVSMGTVDTTTGTGAYVFSNLANGNYRVTLDPADLADAAASVATFDLDGVGTLHTADVTIAGANITTADFGYRGTSTISDTIYFDANNDGDQDAGEVGLSGIDVTARWAGDDGILDTADDLVLSATTNATGNYAFTNLFSGSYRVDVDQADLPTGTNTTPTSGGTGSNISVGADPLTLTAGTALAIGENRNTVDFGYTGTGSLGDFVFHDVDADGVQDAGEPGLAGIDITLTWAGQDGTLGNADDVTYTTTTGAGGGYLFPNLAAGVFSVNIDQADLPAGLTVLTSGAGSVGSDPFATTLTSGQNRTNADFGYTGTGSIGDTVWYDADGDGTINGTEVGISGVTVQLTWAGLDGDISTAADNLIFSDVTDASGNYSFANLPVDIAGGANTGLYQVAVLTGSLPAGFTSATYDLDGIGTANVASLTLTSGTPTRTDADFGYRGTGALGNRVYHDTNGNGSFDAGDLGLAGVDVTLRWAGQDGNFGTADDVTRSTTTNGTGNYGFSDLVAGDFRVDIDNADLPAGITTITSGGAGSDVSVGTDPFTTNLTSGENDQTVDFGYRGTGSIGDKVYADIDGDGTEDAIDYGLANVGITLTWAGLDGDLTTAADNVVYTTTTNGSGVYSVANLAPGTYRATVNTGTLPAGYSVPVADLDGGSDSTADLTLTNGQNRTDVDFGYKGTGSISDTVWLDADGSGTQNALEAGIAGVTIDLVFDLNNDGLLDGGDVVVATTTTDANGNYSFSGLVPDRYLVRVTDTGSKLTSATSTYDKDDYGTAANNGLAAVDLSAAENDAAVDFGYQGAASIGNRVWNDRNADGVQDAGEFGAVGLTVNLYKDLNGDGDYADAGEGIIATTTTGVDGAYLFSGLIAGSYIVELPTPPPSSTNTFDKDDYGVAANNSSAKVTLSATENDLAVDFGYQGSASVGDFVWYDANNDGVQDASEPPIPGVRVYLDIDGDGTYDAATEPTSTTNAGGIYSITGLIGGTYTARVDTSTLPAGYVATFDRDGSGSPDATTFLLGGAQNLTTVDWGYIGTLTVSGRSYHDLDKNGAFNGADTGLGGVTIALVSDTNNNGAVDAGDFTVYTTTTGANGTYSFSTVISGNYLVVETQLAGYGSLENGNLIDIVVAGASVTGQNFGNTTGSLAGRVFSDLDDSGAQNGAEAGIAGANVRLEWSGADNTFGTADDRTVTATTNALGDYLFDHTNTAGFVANGDSTAGLLSTGQYRIVETTPAGYIDGADAAGNAAAAPGAVDAGTESAAWLLANPASGTGRGADRIAGIQIGTAQAATGYNFGEILPSSISGSVHEDLNGNARHDAGEPGIAGSLIRLTGTDIYGRSVSTTVTTDGNGLYRFTGLYASSPTGYTLSQLVQPSAYNDGLEGAGSIGGISGFEFISQIVLATNVNATNYTFGEIVIPPVLATQNSFFTPAFSRPAASPSVLSGYFYNVFENFLGDSEEDDEELDYLLDAPGNEPEPILSLMPMYSGHAEPGSTIVVEIKNVRGAVIGTETIIADAGGNWLAKFPSNIVYDTPTSVMQTVTRASYSDSPDEEFNFRTYFSPTINPSHFFTQPFDVDKVFSENLPQEEVDNFEESLGESQNLDWNGFNYEFLTEPGVPSA